ncbi:hypothetical protein HG421_12415 [Xanthomonas campestris pv. badrii]|uniref:Uncharacterized protein n=1 Tax=Xanthomonas campestris pv. badrii TaxID=149696 RepID=A0A7Z2VEI7_XANCA|nr:hypothetical protein HG421_12415 [Xanthomonas campestris pv. badrii]
MALHGKALAAGKPADRDEANACAPPRCLDHDSVRSGKYADDQLRERSYLPTTDAMDNAKPGATDRLNRCADASTAEFDKKTVPMKDDARRGPFHAIFAQRMGFYRSPALADFIGHEL